MKPDKWILAIAAAVVISSVGFLLMGPRGVRTDPNAPPSRAADLGAPIPEKIETMRDAVVRMQAGSTASIHVTVMDAERRPVPNASVRYYSTKGDLGTFLCDDAGQGGAPVAIGQYRLLVDHPSFLESYMESVEVAAGQEVGVEVYLRSGRRIAGQVIYEGGAGIADVRVALRPMDKRDGEEPRTFRVLREEKTDGNGVFSVAGLDGSDYAIEVMAPGCVPPSDAIRSARATPGDAKQLLPMHQVLACNLKFMNKGRGVLVANGDQVTINLNCDVKVMGPVMWGSGLTPTDRQTFNAQQGLFAWRVSCSRSLGAGQTVTGWLQSPLSSEAIHVRLARIDCAEVLEPQLQEVAPRPTEAACCVRFEYDNGTPINTEHIIVLRSSTGKSTVLDRITSRNSGMVVMLPAGQYDVVAKPGWATLRGQSVALSGLSESVIQVPRGADLRFDVVDGVGRAVSRFKIRRLVGVRGDAVGVSVKDIPIAGNQLILTNYPVGVYELELSRTEAGQATRTAFEVAKGESLARTLVL